MARILVVAPNWIGDALMAQPLFTSLKRSGAHLDVLAPEWVAPVLRRMPEVSDVIPGAFRHGALQLAERWRVGRELKERGYDSAEPHLRAISDRHGNIMVLMTHNTDISDAWEREGEDPRYFYLFSPRGYAVGINAIMYAMTH